MSATGYAPSSVMLDGQAVEGLRAQLRGRLLTPSDADYDTARRLYNAMIDKHPALIAQCVDAADVVSAVNFARDHHLPLAIRGGGHNGPGFGSVDDGLVIDLSSMRGVRVDPADTTVRVEGGKTGEIHGIPYRNRMDEKYPFE